MSSLIARVRRVRDGAQGMTLVELLITMLLMGVVSSLVVVAVVQATRVLTHNDDEERGLQDAKVIFDRLARDVRQARGIVCDGAAADPGCASHLQVWVDSNSDYVEQPTEVITWRLQPDADGVHSDVYRVVGTGAGGTPQTVQREASSLIVNTLFTYYGVNDVLVTDPAQAQRVDIQMTYDAILGQGTAPRTVDFSARLRNKG